MHAIKICTALERIAQIYRPYLPLFACLGRVAIRVVVFGVISSLICVGFSVWFLHVWFLSVLFHVYDFLCVFWRKER